MKKLIAAVMVGVICQQSWRFHLKRHNREGCGEGYLEQGGEAGESLGGFEGEVDVL